MELSGSVGEQKYADRDITFTRLGGDYEIEAAIVSYTK